MTDLTVKNSILIKTAIICKVYVQLYFSEYCSFFFIKTPKSSKKIIVNYKFASQFIGRN